MSIDSVKKIYVVRTSLFVFAVSALVLGWSITPAQAHCMAPHSHKNCNGDPPPDDEGGGTIPVMVTFDDGNRDAVGEDGLMSDGMGDYIDKVERVSVGIGSTGGLNGQLAMHLGVRGKQPAIRQLFLDFSDCRSPPNCSSPSLPDADGVFGQENGFTHGGVNLYTSGVNLKDVVDDGTSRPLNMSVGMDLNIMDQGIWRLFFYYTSFADCPGGTTIGVTRTSADTWEIEAGTYAVACLAQQVGAQGYIFKGLYSMPFLMRGQKK